MKEFLHKNRLSLIILIIALAALIRSYNINGALFEINPLRQAVNAAISRNYVQNPGSNFLLPQIDNFGPSPGYFMFELPILPYLTSFLIRSAGLHNWVFRLPSIILFVISAIYFYKLCLRILDLKASTLALAFYCLTPVSIFMSREFQSESFMMAALFFSLYHFIRWIEDEETIHLLLSMMGFTVFFLLKITNMYMFILVIGLFFIYRKERLFPRFIIPAAFILLVNFWWWFVYSAYIRGLCPNPYTLTDGNVQMFSLKFVIDLIRKSSLSSAYWMLTLNHCLWLILSPLLVVLALAGIFVKKDKKAAAVLLTWLLAVLFFIFAVPSAAMQTYYKIHLVPPVVMLSSIAYISIIDRIKNFWAKKIVIFAFWTVFVASVFLIVYPIIRCKPIFEKGQWLGNKVKSISRKEDLIITSMGSDAMLLFYCNRKGWTLYLGEGGGDSVKLLEEMRREGARYYACGNLDELDGNPRFKDYLFKNYKLISEEDKAYSEPKEDTLEHIVWKYVKGSKSPLLNSVRDKLECSSLGYVIFDLNKKWRHNRKD